MINSVKQTSMSFSEALLALKDGKLIAREGWNGKGMFLYLVSESVIRAPLNGIFQEGASIDYCAHIDMKTADGSFVPWIASQSDILCSDWKLVNPPLR